MERKYYNIELDQANATKLSFYLKSNKIYYELSKAFNLYHFEILMNQDEYKKASAYIERL